MDMLIEDPSQITAQWLSAALRAHGALASGQVTQVLAGEAQKTFASHVYRLAVCYSEDAPPGLPARLFLKLSNPALAPGQFDPQQLAKEINFYREVAPLMNEAHSPLTIPCYHAVYQPATGAGDILLQDLSDTHSACPDPASPRYREQAVDALAALHACWWDHPLLGKTVSAFPSPQERQQEIVDAQNGTAGFLAALGEQVDQRQRAVYARVLAALPGLFRRHATGRNLTLVHGDAHLGNFLFARDGGPAVLLDWQFWHATIGGTDLAFLLASETDSALRRNEERPLLERYYRHLLAAGVRGYSWQACWDDYRLSVILVSLFIPVWRWSIFQWEPDFTALARGMAAYEELKCEELME